MTLTTTDSEQPEQQPESPPPGFPLPVPLKSLVSARAVRIGFTVFVVTAVSLFVIWNLRPWLWITDTTPTGGDLGAHVWSPKFLRDELIPSFRLSGWTSDWYAGFPAFTFYMVLPSLLIVMINVGLSGPLPVIASILIAGGAMRARVLWGHTTGRAASIYGVAGLLWILSVPISYGIAMKFVVVLGLVTLPVAAWAAGRLSGLAYPGPAMLSVASLLFIFDRSFNIYGGNLMSTMAGEFAFSISLSLAMLYIGVAALGMQTGRHRGLAAVLLAASALSHLFPAMFAVAFTVAWFLIRPGLRAFVWGLATALVSFLLAAFWIVPFYVNRAYLNDMGWGKERRFVQALWSRSGSFGDQAFLSNSPMLQLFLVLAIIGAIISGFRRIRFGMAMSMVAMAFAVIFVLLPEGRLWNVRIVPFYYLAVYLMAGVGISEIARGVADGMRRMRDTPDRVADAVSGGLVVIVLGITVVALGMPLRSLPGGSLDPATGAYNWLGLSTKQLNLGPGWVEYNFRGYEDKVPTAGGGGTDEYTDMVATMKRVGQEFGCGRSLWEFENDRLGSYGTPMSPMLLPHWTDRCIGSMEGLYFEASATTPYHFLMQSELSAKPSRAQRDMPYSGLDVEAGVGHLRDVGVRYYMAFSETAVEQARRVDGLEEIATSGPWVIFLVDESPLVVGLDLLPVVVEGTEAGGEHWLVPSIAEFIAPDGAPLIAASGPEEWPRASFDDLAETDPQYAVALEGGDVAVITRHLAGALRDFLPSEAAQPVTVSNISEGQSSLSFDVDRLGEPVLVRVSYFPNWDVSGADGPYRVSPNLMVVVPTSEHVRLEYGRSGIELLSILMTMLGVAALVWLKRLREQSEGGSLWDLTARFTSEFPDRSTVIHSVRTSTATDSGLSELRESARTGHSSAEMRLGITLALVAASLVLSLFIGDRADAPMSSMIVWSPAALGLVLMVFKFGPETAAAVAYERRVLAPAWLISDLMSGFETDEPVAFDSSSLVADADADSGDDRVADSDPPEEPPPA